MKMVLHDLENGGIRREEDRILLGDNGRLRPCIGCFGCWIKTPGTCVIQDGYEGIGQMFSKCDTLTIVSRCCYGGYSPAVHKLLDRSIAYSLPYFETRAGTIHHKLRYSNRMKLSVHFYGPGITPAQQEIARELVQANALNLDATAYEVLFYDSAEAVGRVIA